MRFDTIAACITGLPGPVAIVRISGPRSWEAAAGVFPSWPGDADSHRSYFGDYVTGEDGLVTPFSEGRSYTGEQSVELSLHGSRASVAALLEKVYELGVRPAEPGEFTLRAFMNGRMDLTQAEAVQETVTAATEAQAKLAHRVRHGEIHQRIEAVRQILVGVLAQIEASTDFGEEVGEVDRDLAQLRLFEAQDQIKRLLETAAAGQIVRDGLRIAIVGEPNAGKSSLLNLLLGRDRAIVTPVAGTTRDTLEEPIDLGGIPCILIDTAGMRETQDEVEKIGVERSRTALESADLVWRVYDATLAPPPALPNEILIANKCDLNPTPSAGIPVSALTGEGASALIQTVKNHIPATVQEPLINRRHEPLLSQASEAISHASETLGQPVPDDLAAVGLQQAIRLLGEITGETTPPDVIERIFRDFCIGK